MDSSALHMILDAGEALAACGGAALRLTQADQVLAVYSGAADAAAG